MTEDNIESSCSFSVRFGAAIDHLPGKRERAVVIKALADLTPAEKTYVLRSERESALLALASNFAGSRNAVAKEIERHLARYLSGSWRADQEKEGPGETATDRRWALYRIAAANGGISLAWRQIWNLIGDDPRWRQI